MKNFLLFAAFITGALFSQAQNLPISQNFSNGLPAGWDLLAAQMGTYNRNINTTCTANQGILTSPSGGSSGNNKTGIKTSALLNTGTGTFINVRFNGYAYRGNQFRCQDELFSTTPCTAIGKIYLLSASNGSVLGASGNISLNIGTGINTLTALVNDPANVNVPFKVLLDISFIDCDVNGSVRFVIDNVLIIATEGGPLPVSFKSFTAVRASQNVLLRWETAVEQNSSGFYVQRNTGNGWNNVAFVATKAPGGNSNTDLSYSFTDLNIQKGISQYRIAQVDLDGKVKLSEVRFVRNDQTGKTIVFPNPSFDGKVNVLFDDQTSSRDISIIDLSGRIVKQWSNISNNSLHIDNLKPGFYSIRIYNKSTSEQTMEKLIVNKR